MAKTIGRTEKRKSKAQVNLGAALSESRFPAPIVRRLAKPEVLLPLVAGWHNVLQHLPNRISRQPKLLGHRTLTPAFHTYSSPNTAVYLHLEHPSGVP